MTVQQVKQQFRIIGNCKPLNQAVEIAMQVAPTEVSVLIYGANGTGKDIFSRIIHQYSRRKHEPFIAINCGAIPEGTMDSELFGHEKGSFTSAHEARKGYFEEVEGGTIFLDEIAEMPLATQSRLLRLLENGEYLRVGSSKIRKSNVRVVAATNKNLIDLIHKGKFREDLYFRLNTVTINVPSLIERGEDIELLFNYFAIEFANKYHREPIELTDEANELLYKYRWPGNVREIRNLAEKLTVLIKGTEVNAETLQQNLLIRENYLPSLVRMAQINGGNEESQNSGGKDVDLLYQLIYDLRKEISDVKKMMFMGMKTREREPLLMEEEEDDWDQPLIYTDNSHKVHEPEIIHSVKNIKQNTPVLEESLSLEKKEKEMILRALRKHHDNRKKAAQELGISERTLYRKIKNYGIEV
ncbi:MAG: sigma-54 dependent transcriptional regulator [Bacteroidia bacterium]|nr:sigma-54 dependent transcriptional regulator [Bacteroidia bacterium]